MSLVGFTLSNEYSYTYYTKQSWTSLIPRPSRKVEEGLVI